MGELKPEQFDSGFVPIGLVVLVGIIFIIKYVWDRTK
jgi:hypothetical protein